jgi:hypothetical protein
MTTASEFNEKIAALKIPMKNASLKSPFPILSAKKLQEISTADGTFLNNLQKATESSLSKTAILSSEDF